MVVPVRADVPTRRRPWVTLGITVVNVAVFLYALRLGPDGAAALFDAYGLVPREFLRHVGSGQPVWWTPLSSMFLHGGLLHLAGNLFYLWLFGTQIEELLGHRRFVVFYLACGLAAGAIHVASDPNSWLPTVGASGAISGLLGAYAVTYPTGRLRLLWPSVRVPAIAFLALWFLLQVTSGLAAHPGQGGGTAWWAHVGGFAAGVALVRSMSLRPPTRSRVRI